MCVAYDHVKVRGEIDSERKEGIHTRVRSIFETECKAVLATYLGKHRNSTSGSWNHGQTN